MRRIMVLLACMLLLLNLGCVNSYTLDGQKRDYAINEHEDVLNYHGVVTENRDKLDAFVARSSGNVRVVHYTTEGDPIFNDLAYIGQRIEMRYDTSQDSFGTPRITTTTCSRLDKKETATALIYTLEGCDGEESTVDVLHISFDVAEQDYFEFALSMKQVASSEEKLMEISTFDHKWVKSQPNGEVAVWDDLQLTKGERQRIYKEMVLANYLSNKPLDTICSEAAYTLYDLKVRINGGERHLKWSTCDQSSRGKQMTQLAEQIIHIIQSK